MTCDTTVGQLLSYDGKPVTFDGLGEHAFKMEFAKIPNTMFFLQGVTFPGVSIQTSERSTNIFDLQEVGSKVRFEPFTVQFLVDAEMRNHFEIFEWMQLLTKSQKIEDQVGDALLFVNDKKYIRFVDAFPTNLGSIQFRANNDSLQYVTCSASFNFDWYEIQPI